MTAGEAGAGLTLAEHAARLARTYELAGDLGDLARELRAFAGRADVAAHRRDIDSLAVAAEDIIGLGQRFQDAYLKMLTVRVRPLPAEPFPRPASDGRMSV